MHCSLQIGCVLGKAWWLPGKGLIPADVMFVGEAPRAGESRDQGVFTTRISKLCGLLNVGRTYNSDAVKCPAPEPPYRSRRKPTSDHLDACQMWLAGEIATVNPSAIVPLGATAAWGVVRALGGNQQESRTLSGFERQFGPCALLKGIYVCPLSHPSRIEQNRFDSWLACGAELLRAKIPGL
jgi:uracil-DNA glycosylase family 4